MQYQQYRKLYGLPLKMEIRNSRRILKEFAKKKGIKGMSADEFAKKMNEELKSINKNHYEGFKECWDFALNYYNSSLNLIYGIVIGIFASTFIQSLHWILNEIVKKEYLLLVNISVAGFSGIILLIACFIFFKEIKQIKSIMRRNEKGMKDCKKNH